jgi:DNA invertase Pin-like site-specific DNA recombinase
MPSGDVHYSQRIPERIARGDRHWSRRMPELVKKGEDLPMSRLTAEKVREIRRAYAGGGETYKTLADRYGVSFITIFDAIKRKTWKHVV